METGEVLALVNFTYNPNNRVGLIGAQLRNRAFTDTFEPGSTMKPFTIALALDKGKVRFDTPIDCAGEIGDWSLPRFTMPNHMAYGQWRVIQEYRTWAPPKLHYQCRYRYVADAG